MSSDETKIELNYIVGIFKNKIKHHPISSNKEEEEPQEEYPGHLLQMLYKSGQQSSICHNQDNDDNIPPHLGLH